MAIDIVILFLAGLFFLVWFSTSDLKRSRIENKALGAMFVVGLLFSLFRQQLLPTLVGMALLGGVGYLLWWRKIIGGADAKALIILPCFLGISGYLHAFVVFYTFLLLFLFVGSIYGLMSKVINKKKKKNVPFMPAIAFTYVLYWLCSTRWIF